MCENYFTAGETKFEKLRIAYKERLWITGETIRVCPKCYKDNAGVLVK